MGYALNEAAEAAAKALTDLLVGNTYLKFTHSPVSGNLQAVAVVRKDDR